MTTKPTGGPAYPVIAENGLGLVSDGMTLRDWFAGMAMQGLLVRYGDQSALGCAGLSYEYADAMIEEREK